MTSLAGKTINLRYALGRGAGKAAFTLIEIIIAISLVALIFSFAIVKVKPVLEERNLQKPARQLRLLAKKAFHSAAEQRQPFVIAIKEKTVLLKPQGSNEKEEDIEKKRKFFVGQDILFFIKRVGDKEWREPAEEQWIFQPSGLCEPLSFRFVNKRGELEIDFNPLTARLQEERLEIYE